MRRETLGLVTAGLIALPGVAGCNTSPEYAYTPVTTKAVTKKDVTTPTGEPKPTAKPRPTTEKSTSAPAPSKPLEKPKPKPIPTKERTNPPKKKVKPAPPIADTGLQINTNPVTHEGLRIFAETPDTVRVTDDRATADYMQPGRIATAKEFMNFRGCKTANNPERGDRSDGAGHPIVIFPVDNSTLCLSAIHDKINKK